MKKENQMTTTGLKQAAEMCRAREAGWRKLGDSGGTELHPEHDCWCRAYEAMTCAESIEEEIDDMRKIRYLSCI